MEAAATGETAMALLRMTVCMWTKTVWCTMLAHRSWPLSTAEKAGYAAKLKNALHGRAWTLCQWKAEISAQKLLGLSKGSGDGQGPQAAVKLLVGPVRKACEGWPLF